MAESKSDILQGTLDLMVLQTLDAMGPLHGYGIARRIEQLSEEALVVNGHHLSLPRPPGAEALDHGRVGHVGKQSQGQVLFHFEGGPETTHRRNRNWERIAGVIGRMLQISR